MNINRIVGTHAIEDRELLRLYIDGKLVATHISWIRLVGLAKMKTTGNFTILDNNNNIQ